VAAQAKTTTRKGTAAKSSRARASGEKALQRLQDSVDAAEAALKDLRKEMGRGSRELLTDVETTLRDARKNLRRVSRSVVKDLEGVQKAAAGKRTTQRRASARPATRRTSTRARAAKK
jgi:predicted  nucleic acid-binding Zn-ribbon protein